MSGAGSDLDQVVAAAVELEKWPLARLIGLFEDPRPQVLEPRQRVMALLDKRGLAPHAAVFGITGTPGTGKSTLLGEVAARLIQQDTSCRVAVLAVDPSSQRSGGSILGDRTRVHFPIGERRLFFRSQASDRELGGIGRATYSVVRLLERLFDYVFVETVGIGQSEIEVERLADRVYLVLQPLAGDQVQFMKAGIMEVPHVFILNKADAGEAARRSYYALRASIDFARPGEREPPLTLRTSAVSGEGIDQLVEDVCAHRMRPAGTTEARERYFLEKWVRDEYGRFGLELLEQQGGASRLLTVGGTFEAAQAVYVTPIAGIPA